MNAVKQYLLVGVIAVAGIGGGIGLYHASTLMQLVYFNDAPERKDGVAVADSVASAQRSCEQHFLETIHDFPDDFIAGLICRQDNSDKEAAIQKPAIHWQSYELVVAYADRVIMTRNRVHAIFTAAIPAIIILLLVYRRKKRSL